MNHPNLPNSKESAPLRWWRSLNNPSAAAEAIVWAFLILTVFAIRAYLVHLIPVALWSDDANSYASSAFKWVHTGVWATDPRRGPVYSLLIAACAKVTGNVDSVMITQHILGGISVLVAMVSLRALYGRALLVPIALCSYAYAVYGLPIYLEQLIRNETLIFFFSSVSFASWLAAIKFEKPNLLWITGIAAGLLMSTKSVFGPFPLAVVLGHLFYWRATPGLAVKFALVFSIAFVLPIVGIKVLKKATADKRPPQPQSGILLYARTAQFTYLEGGIEPEIKEQIRKEVEEYRQDHLSPKPHFNNNTIIYVSIIPHLRRILTPQGKLPADVNKLCIRLALEAISHNKARYALQVLNDLQKIHLKGGYRLGSPTPKDLSACAEKLKKAAQEELLIQKQLDCLFPGDQARFERRSRRLDSISQKELENNTKKPKHLVETDPLMHIENRIAQLEFHAQEGPKHFKTFHRLRKTAWMFLLAPALFTSLLLPLILFRTRGKMQLFWIGAAGVWFFTVVLLSTVGRPLDRYLLPAGPVMFLTLSTGVIYLWQSIPMLCQWIARFLTKKRGQSPSPASPPFITP